MRYVGAAICLVLSWVGFIGALVSFVLVDFAGFIISIGAGFFFGIMFYELRGKSKRQTKWEEEHLQPMSEEDEELMRKNMKRFGDGSYLKQGPTPSDRVHE